MTSPATSLGEGPSAVLAFDVGGTFIKAGMVNAAGSRQSFRRVPTPLDPMQPAEAVLDRVAELARDIMTEQPQTRIEAIGLTVPGIVDHASGTGVYSANLGWRDFPFTKEAEKRLGLPVAFGHDVAAAGTAELRMGGRQDFQDALVMIVGTGIAAAVFCAGRPVSAGGYAGEIGQALVPDPAGGTRILESIGSAAAIARRYQARSGNLVNGSKAVLDYAAGGDMNAVQVWAEAMDALAFSIAQCVNIIGTEAVIIGGGLSLAGEALLTPLRDRVDALLTFHRRPKILPATLGQEAGLIGAALNARALLLKQPFRFDRSESQQLLGLQRTIAGTSTPKPPQDLHDH